MTSKEALDIILKPQDTYVKGSGKTNLQEFNIQERLYAKTVLNNLVERDTPMKVIRSDNSSVISADCPKCKRVVDNDYKGCPYCLQRLDWSK